jgi:predicted NBD/HSP70 family sugar kinase
MKKQIQTFIGIDIGGTKMLIGELDAKGEILQYKRYKTGFTDQQQAVRIILEALDDYISEVGVIGVPQAVGLGVVGVIDHAKGIWVEMDHIRSNPVPLAEILTHKLGIPATIDNDVRCATTAELLLGYGRETKNFIYMNVGTGIAAGFVSEGRIIRGQNNNSGEIGHMVVDYNSEISCICGRTGCIEAIASGSGFTNRVKELSKQNVKTRLTLPENGEGVNTAEIFKLADEGDELCTRLTQDAADVLACGIMNLVRVSDPEAFILGGGVVSDGWILPKILERLNKGAMRGVTRGILISKLDPDFTGLIGAAAIAMVHSGFMEGENRDDIEYSAV